MWNTGGPGAYPLTGTATDNSGATATSSEVNVQVTSDAFVAIEAADPNAAEGNPPNPAKLTVRRWGRADQALEVPITSVALPPADRTTWRFQGA